MPDAPERATTEGVLLTVDYVTVGERAAVRLWLAGEEGARAVLDPSFEPYFYAVPADGVDPAAVAARLEDLQAGGSAPARCEVVARTEGLGEIEVVRLVARHPQDVPALRNAARKVDGVAGTREDDVLFANRYLVDERIRPLTWTRVETEPSELVPGEHEVRAVEQDPDREVDLHAMAFDLEVYNPRVTPDASRDPIVVASVADDTGYEEVLTKPEDGDDEQLIRDLAERIRERDPDVIATYNGDNFDWPYLVDRAEEHGIELPVGRDGSEPDVRQAGRGTAVTVTGRGNVDGYQMAQRDLPDVKVKTLERVAQHLGVDGDPVELDASNMAEIWDDPSKRETLLDYAIDDARNALGVVENLLGLQVGLCRRTFQDLSDGSRMGRGRQADWYLLGEAHQRGLLAPGRDAHRGTSDYEGGVVLEPPAGIHEDVVYLDFSSMYPSIMVAYNVSPETYVVPGGEPKVDTYQAPEVGHRFRAEPDGFFKRLLEELIDRRQAIKDERADLPTGDPDRDRLDVEERAVKVLTNAFYGYMGWSGARWQSVPCAEATTAWGRHFIQKSVDVAREMDLEVLYGDTDSVMVRDHENVAAYIDRVNEELPIELEVEHRFDALFFTGAKKRYAGRTETGETIIRGLEVRRGDWCSYAKDLQADVIDALLGERDADEATRRAQAAVEALREGEVPVDELLIHKTLTRHPSNYDSKQPHAMAVENAQQREPEFQAPVGSKIGYVIVEDDSDLVSERARLADFLDGDETIDDDYYIEKQVVPAAERVLGYFGVDADEIKGRPSQSSLGEWM